MSSQAEHIHLAVPRDGLVDHALDVFGARDVRLHSGSVDARGRFLGTLAVHVDRDDLRAFGRQLVGNRLADSLRRAGDDRDSILQLHLSAS